MTPLPDEIFQPGRPDKPLAILIHGHGASRQVWSDPTNEWIRDKGGVRLLPFALCLSVFDTPDPACGYRLPGRFSRIVCSTPLAHAGRPVRSFWDALSAAGHPLYAWSQSEPNGPVDVAIDELARAVPRALELAGRDRCAILGHSRGALVARAWLADRRATPRAVTGMVLVAPPNLGSGLAAHSRWLGRFADNRLLPFLLRMIPTQDRHEMRVLSRFLMRLLKYARGPAIEELMPRSTFIRWLRDRATREAGLGIPMHVVAGNSPAFTRVFYELGNGTLRELFAASKGLRWPLFPDEVCDGKGDGLVAVSSTALAHATHYPIRPVNHGTIMVDEATQDRVVEIMGTF